MSAKIHFEMEKDKLKEGIYEFKYYDSMGYSSGEFTLFLYEGYVYLYNDENISYKYNKPYSQCSGKELEKFVNEFVEEDGDFTYDSFTSQEEWDKDYENGNHWDNFDKEIKWLADNNYEIFEPYQPKKRIKYKSFLVRNSNNYDVVFFIIKLEDEKYWQEAKEYMWKKREEDSTYNYREDQDIMEEYWQNNNIKYIIVDMPNNELFL